MTLFNYYQIIKQKYLNNEFQILKIQNIEPIYNEKTFHLETQHYLMYEYWKDRNDSRILDTFNWILIPNDLNQGELDIDFTKWNFEIFLDGLILLKD